MPRDDYNETSWAVCSRCGRIHKFAFGHQGDTSKCRDETCRGKLIYPGGESAARKKSREIING